MVSQSAATFPLSRTLPVLQLIEASVGGSPNAGTLLSAFPFHQFIINQGFLGKFGDIQQLYYFVDYFLKGEKETKWNKFIFNHWILKDFFFLKQSKYSFISTGALNQVVIKNISSSILNFKFIIYSLWQKQHVFLASESLPFSYCQALNTSSGVTSVPVSDHSLPHHWFHVLWIGREIADSINIKDDKTN